MSETAQKPDHEIITETDLASALDGTFLEKVKELAWRGKKEKLADVEDKDIHSFNVFLAFSFLGDPEDKESLSFSKMQNYRFHIQPITYADLEKFKEKEGNEENLC